MADGLTLSRSVKGSVVLVTGAGSGMGAATARVFADEGALVAVTDVNGEAAAAVATAIREAGGQAHAWTLDVGIHASIQSVVAEVADRFGGLDILVNNAGISVFRPIDDAGYDAAWDQALAVMLTGTQRMIRAALPHLRRSKAPRIANIASTEALGRHQRPQRLQRRQGRDHGPDTLAGRGAGPRRHHRELHLSGPDQHRHDRAAA